MGINKAYTLDSSSNSRAFSVFPTNRMYYIVLCTIFLGGFFENACIKNCLMHNKCIRFLCCSSVVGWCVKCIRPSMFCFLINVGVLFRAVSSSLLGQSIDIVYLFLHFTSWPSLGSCYLFPAFDQIQNLISEVGSCLYYS